LMGHPLSCFPRVVTWVGDSPFIGLLLSLSYRLCSLSPSLHRVATGI
jgi:hypothetical protein